MNKNTIKRRRNMKKRNYGLLIALCIILTCVGLSAQKINAVQSGKIYYVDASVGEDSNDGLSTSTPWKTLSKVRDTEFQPGDKILFKRDEIWAGQLSFIGSGSVEAPIIIDQYGEGLSKPKFIGDESLTETVKIYNQNYIEVNNLDISADYTTERTRKGVHVENSDFGTMKHVYLKNLIFMTCAIIKAIQVITQTRILVVSAMMSQAQK